jgi:hypothetical protein
VLFNTAGFDKYFHAVIKEARSAFRFIVYRPTSVINPRTRISSSVHQLVTTGIGDWNHPKEKLDYELNGRIRCVDSVMYIPRPVDLRKGDLIYKTDSGEYFDVLNARDFQSHFQVEASFVEKGFNFSPTGVPQTPYFVENDVVIG